jgi:hypothetical protein
MSLSHRFLDDADRADALEDERRDDEREFLEQIDALSRAALTPWPPEGVDVERVRQAREAHDRRAERRDTIALLLLAVVTLAWCACLAVIAAEVMAG